jgi:hypothetical protein
MMKFLLILMSVFCLCSFSSCGNGGDVGVYTSLRHVTVDSSNDRLFLFQSEKELFVYEALALEAIGDQPLVQESTNADIYNLLPITVSQMAVYANGDTSRLFFLGAKSSDTGFVLNQILVLDFDGTSFTEADISPITLSDGDDDTDETINSFADLLVDQDNGVLYVTDATAGQLYAISATDGTITGPTAIAGNPQGMALSDGHLYVCNSSEEEAEQVITVINTDDATTTTIDVDAPCYLISVASNDNGTVMLTKQSDAQTVYIRQINTDSYDDQSEISSNTSGISNGLLSGGRGITSTISDMVITKDAAGVFYAYLSEWDGNIQAVTISADLSGFSVETLSTSATNLSQGSVLVDSSNNGTAAYLVSEAGALIDITVGTTHD